MPRNEKAPAFQVYAADDLADAQMMTDEQFGKWNRLRALAWRDMGLPADPEQLAAILRVKPKDFAKLWAIVGAQFVERRGRYVLPWQEKQREKHAALRERNVTNGLHGGRPPKQPENPPPNPNGTHWVPKEEAGAKPDESSSSFSLLGSEQAPSSSPAGEPERGARPTPGAVARILVIAANQAVADVWGESTAPYLPANGPSHELAVVVLDEGIPVDLARSAVFTACKAFCAKAKKRGDPQHRPNAMNYFAKPVRDAWASAQAKDDATHAARPAELSAPPGAAVVPFQRFPSAAERLSERSRANTRMALAAIRAEREGRSA